MDDGRLQSLVRHSLRVVVAHSVPVPRMPGFRRPSTKVPGRALFANRKDEDDFGLEDLVQDYPWAFRSKELIAMEWDGFAASSMSFSALQLDRQTWLYFELTDSEDGFLSRPWPRRPKPAGFLGQEVPGDI